MASAKDTFEANTFAANTFACGVFRGVGVEVTVPTMPGLEHTLPERRMHFELPDNLCQVTLPKKRMHFEIPEED